MGAWDPKPYTSDGKTSRYYREGTTAVRGDTFPSGVEKRTVVHAAIAGIQHALRREGHDLTVDGYFGGQTDNAVKAYQTANTLTVDGVVGPNTAKKLFGSILAEQEAQYGIPDKLLHGKTDLESGFDPGAVGANGWDTGIAQINLDPNVHGNAISLEQACNPVWAIPYTAERHDAAFRQYTDTLARLARDAAVGQHNSPLAVKLRLEGAMAWPQGPKTQSDSDRIQVNVDYVTGVRTRAERF